MPYTDLADINHDVPPGDIWQIDAEIAESINCPDCGQPMRFDSHFVRQPRVYRAFAVCRECRNSVEF